MRWAVIMVVAGLVACGQSAPNPYPETAKARFEQSCPPASEVCVCTWEHITQALTYEEYEAALARMRTEGLMDPRVTQARVWCLEHHSS